MHEFAVTILAFALILGVLVFVHEMGHYLAARWRGVKVDTFSIGFGPALYRWRDRTGTEWRISAIPLGGFVKPHGFEDPEDATPEQKASWVPGQTFHDKPVGSRMLVIVMGPVFNFIFAILLFTVLFTSVGKPEMKNEIAQVAPHSAAEKAGLQKGDVITRLGSLDVFNFADIQAHAVTMPGVETTLGIKRGDQTLSLPIKLDRVPGKLGAPDKGSIGVMAELVPGKPCLLVGPSSGDSMRHGMSPFRPCRRLADHHRSSQRERTWWHDPYRPAFRTGRALWICKHPVLHGAAVDQSRPDQPVSDSAARWRQAGFYVAEAVRGKPVSRRVQEVSYQAGFALIAALFLFSTFNDLSNLGLFH